MAKSATEKKTKEDDYTYDVWNARISLAKAARQPLIDDGNKNIDNYEGKILAKGYKNTIAVNLAVVDMKQSVPECYAQNPKIFVDPDEPGAESDAHIAELVINKKWGDLKMKPLCRDAIKSVKLRGMCGFKT